MKKTVLYLGAAVILGVLITVVPLVTIAEIGNENIATQTGPAPSSVSKGFGQLEGQVSPETSLSDRDLAVLAISFVIALAAYALTTHRAPRRYNLRLGIPPY
jgi:hypothetical protein